MIGIEDEARRGLVDALSDCRETALPEELKNRVTSSAQLGLVEFLPSWTPGFVNYFNARSRFISELKEDDSIQFPVKHSSVMIKFMLRKEMLSWAPNFSNFNDKVDD